MTATMSVKDRARLLDETASVSSTSSIVEDHLRELKASAQREKESRAKKRRDSASNRTVETAQAEKSCPAAHVPATVIGGTSIPENDPESESWEPWVRMGVIVLIAIGLAVGVTVLGPHTAMAAKPVAAKVVASKSGLGAATAAAGTASVKT
eukprot:PhM_4_TR5145/c5_g1_i1/m.75535